MDAVIPVEIREILERFLPRDTPWDIDLRYQRVLASAPYYGPASMAVYGIAAVTLPRAVRALRAVGRSLAGIVMLHPDFGDLDTAAGIALLGHEMVHQHQFAHIPNFQLRYSEESRFTPSDKPWENRFEHTAYMQERTIYCRLVNEGVPPGIWVPLGVQLWGC